MARSAVVPSILCILLALCACLEGSSLSAFSLEGLLSGLSDADLLRPRRLTGGTQDSGCTYPGVVAITFKGKVICNGVYKAGSVTVPDYCSDFMSNVNKIDKLVVYGDDGTASAEFAKSSVKGATSSNGDGTSTISLSTDLASGNCASNDYIAYDPSMSVDTSQCQIVSYGGADTKLFTFNNVLQTTPLVSNPLQACCSSILANLQASASLGSVDKANLQNYYTCAKTAEGVCSGDIGAPIYCLDTASSKQVVVGMATTASCTAGGETFVSVDLTGGQLSGFSA